jgi:hypothetical protein
MNGWATGGWLRGWLLGAACFALLAAPASAAPVALHVIPFPGTPDASRLSHVIFSALTPAELVSVSVTGSDSGPHLGRLDPLPDGAGTAFVPDAPFASGERVSVTATLASAAAGTASGDPSAKTLGFSFTVARPVHFGPGNAPAQIGSKPGRATSRSDSPSTPTQSFRSAPDLHPPVVSATSTHGAGPGDILIAPNVIGKGGPMILDGSGRLLWFRPVAGIATNLEVQHYEGQPVLTWWQGRISGGSSRDAEDVIMNRSYHVLKVLRAGYGYSSDLHEFQITPQGTALIDDFVPVQSDLSSVGGRSEGPLDDCVIQELDVKTGQVLWEWHALGHIPLTASYSSTPGAWYPWQSFHLNSIEQLPNGNLLISARATWSVYEIDKQTGRVIWTLGGKDPSIHDTAAANFEWQHDAHLIGNTLTVFDDAADPQEESQSSVKVIHLNTDAMTASLVRRYTHSPPLLAGAVGSAQLLPDGHVFVGWGNTGQFSEYTRSGRQIFNGSLPFPVFSYRAYKFPWSGQPTTPPSQALSRQSDGSMKVYASWNGATRVAAWRVLAGPSPGSLHVVSRARRTGFETVMALRQQPRYVAVQALDAGGNVLGTSPAQAGRH